MYTHNECGISMHTLKLQIKHTHSVVCTVVEYLPLSTVKSTLTSLNQIVSPSSHTSPFVSSHEHLILFLSKLRQNLHGTLVAVS